MNHSVGVTHPRSGQASPKTQASYTDYWPRPSCHESMLCQDISLNSRLQPHWSDLCHQLQRRGNSSGSWEGPLSVVMQDRSGLLLHNSCTWPWDFQWASGCLLCIEKQPEVKYTDSQTVWIVLLIDQGLERGRLENVNKEIFFKVITFLIEIYLKYNMITHITKCSPR